MKVLVSIIIYSFLGCQNNAPTPPEEGIEQVTTVEDTPVTESDTFLVVEEVFKSNDASEVAIADQKTGNSIIQEDKISKKESAEQLKNNVNKEGPDINTTETVESKPRISSTEVVIPAVVGSSDDVKASVPTEEVIIKKRETKADVSYEIEKSPLPKAEESMDKEAISLDHSAFNDLLQKHISSAGVVNYTAFKKDEAKLDQYLQHLSDNTPANGWSKNKGLAYWMNAYNAATIKLILKNYPVNKIIDLDGGKPWDVSWITLGDKTYSLNDIEHKTIRPTYNDARIHFAVNCAAKSCPPIWNQAFIEANVNEALTRLTKQFVNSSANQISKSQMSLSKIFEWYAEDFGNIHDFINQYSDVKVSEDASVSHSDYDWSLNGK